MTEIIPNLYLGGLKEVMEECASNHLRITHILNVASEINADRSDTHTYMHLGVDDDHPKNDITTILHSCVDWIDQAMTNGGRVFVHCWSGVSRAPCVIMAYLIKKQRLSCVDAFHKVLANRPIIDPWPPYMRQLHEWAEHDVQ